MKQYTNLVLAIPHAVGEPLDFDWRKIPDVAAFHTLLAKIYWDLLDEE